MKRISRVARFAGLAGHVVPIDETYLPRHALGEDIISELEIVLNEMCEALGITASYINEVVKAAQERIEKIARAIKLRKIPVNIPVVRCDSVLGKIVEVEKFKIPMAQ